MLAYLVALALGLMAVYALRSGLLILQNRRDERERRARLKAAARASGYIIPKNSEQCKRFEQAS